MEQDWFASWFDSRYYPILYQHRDYQEAESFIQYLTSALSPAPGSRILDLACGRGRHSVFLNKMGFEVTGVDLSPQSIADARAHENETLRFHVRDMREPFSLGGFNYIFNLFTSFGYFEDPSENLKVLRNIHSSLAENGTLVLDYFNIEKVRASLVPEEEKTLDGIEFGITREEKDGFIVKTIIVNDDGKISRFQERVQALGLADFQKLAEGAGLEIFQTWGDYAGGEFEAKTSPRLILFCRKAN